MLKVLINKVMFVLVLDTFAYYVLSLSKWKKDIYDDSEQHKFQRFIAEGQIKQDENWSTSTYNFFSWNWQKMTRDKNILMNTKCTHLPVFSVKWYLKNTKTDIMLLATIYFSEYEFRYDEYYA